MGAGTRHYLFLGARLILRLWQPRQFTARKNTEVEMKKFDLANCSVRELNQTLHAQAVECSEREWQINNPRGQHNIACGLDQQITVDIQGHTGYFCAGMNKSANVTISGNAGQGLAENMMSGTVRVKGDASACAGATARGGLLVIEGNAGARCGISMKGVDIVVKGSVGHMSCFMAQAGTLVVCGDAGDALGDSLYETKIYIKGSVKSLGADCIEKDMAEEHMAELSELLHRAGIDENPDDFKRYGSARQLYNFKIEIDYSIKRIKFLMKRDKGNMPVNFEKGWSHYEARRYLMDYALQTSYYDHLYYEKWSASSDSLKLGEGIFCNKITYHIDGGEDAIKCLTLVLEVEEVDQFEGALNKFREISNHLFQVSVSAKKELNINIEEAEGNDSDIYQTHMTEIEGRQIMIQKRNHVNLDTFELRLSFSVDKNSFKYTDTI
jgi:glutamate synthase domain-containing protein 3